MSDTSEGGAGNEDPPLDQHMLVEMEQKVEKLEGEYPLRATFQPEVTIEVHEDGSSKWVWSWVGSLRPRAEPDTGERDAESQVATFLDTFNRTHHGGNRYRHFPPMAEGWEE